MLTLGWKVTVISVIGVIGDGLKAPVNQEGEGQFSRAAGQGRVVQRVRIPPRKVGQPPGSESLEVGWQHATLSVGQRADRP